MEEPPKKNLYHQKKNSDSLPKPIIPLTEIKDKVSSILKPKKETKRNVKKLKNNI